MSNESVRCLLVPVDGARLLMPNSVVAEVAAWNDPEPLESAPEWLLGELHWNDWKVPVVSYSVMAGESTDEAPENSARILIIRTLAESGPLPYLGIVIHGLPRLATVEQEHLGKTTGARSRFIHSRVELNDEKLLLPEIDQLVEEVTLAMYDESDATSH